MASTMREMPGQGVDDPLGMTLEELIPRWCRLVWWAGIQPVYQRMLEINLTLAESVVLRGLQRTSLTIAEVAQALCLSHSAASRAVDRLVNDGFVGRHENPDDRRQKLLTLTPEGAVLVRQMEAIFSERLQPMIATLSAGEREQLRSLIARMVAGYVETTGGTVRRATSEKQCRRGKEAGV